MQMSPRLKRTAWILISVLLPVVALVAVFDWNWFRHPIERAVERATGRALSIAGNLDVKLGWPLAHVRVGGVAFANPSWAAQSQMIEAEAVEFDIDIEQLFARSFVLPEVRLDRALVHLEQSRDGRKNWLLDKGQQDENARVRIGRVKLDRGQIMYDDVARGTTVQSEISTPDAHAEDGSAPGVVFHAKGRYKGLAFVLGGSGGPVLALRDESVPYPVDLQATIGHTSLRARGRITSLSAFSAVDMQITLRGNSLADLFPVLGIALPDTHPYRTAGRIVHSGRTWRYEKFSGTIGESDIAGTIQVVSGGTRPRFEGDLVSRQLVLEDLGPLVGTAAVEDSAANPDQTQRRVLPAAPFRTERWESVDADVKFRARTIRQAHSLPLENLATHLRLKDAVLTLNPLDFGVAGGKLAADITLDGRRNPIRARARVAAKELRLNKLFPAINLTRTSVGEINGEFNLAGTGNSVARMLATSSGGVDLIVDGGEISNLMLEMVGLDVFEALKFKILGDKTVKIRCGVAGFRVDNGLMRTEMLVLDTDDTNVGAVGNIDLGEERLDLTLHPEPKDRSPVALRGPIRVRGNFAGPRIELDKGVIATRGIGALALGLVNPLLALLPLIETGPGKDSACGELIEQAKSLTANALPAPRSERPGRKPGRSSERTAARARPLALAARDVSADTPRHR